MKRQRRSFSTPSAAAALLISLSSIGLEPASAADSPAPVNAARLDNAERDSGNWLSYGRTYSEQRYSPLARISDSNAKQLGLAWYADLDTDRGQESTPLVIDGMLYVSTAWSMVKAYDAKTGKPLWSYDPQVPRELGVNGCCDVVSRGIAAWNGKIYVATFDGRLIAVDAKTGKDVWSVVTVDRTKPYTITGAPRVFKGKVVIGNSGAEYGVRGYISAYDAETGKMVWRFYTVPGNPAEPFENKAMEMAAKTWAGEWWKEGGGGTVWDAISYDPELNLVYFGVGNGLEWPRARRSADKGDNLFLSSIVALNADTGAYVWHYQATPGEEWDFDAVQQLMLADLELGGKRRQVLMQANKNGFFYVLDRRMVYIPAQEIGKKFTPLKDFQISPEGWNLGVAVDGTPEPKKGYLLAWDPVKQKEVWRADHRGPWNGGAVATGGNLVAQGDAAGYFNVYRADTGEKLWSTFAQSAIMAGPVTYEVDGEQYIAVLSGWGSAFSLQAGRVAASSGNLRNVSRVLVFKLGGTATLPPLEPRQLVINPPADTANAATIATGGALFGRFCSVCHGESAVGGGVVPDLRASSFLGNDFFYEIVLNGAMKDNGMASFKSILDHQKVEAIRAYVIHRANEDKQHP